MASIQQHNHPRSTDRLEYLSTWRLSRKGHHPHPVLSNQTLQEHSGPILPAGKVRAVAAAAVSVVAAVSHKRQQAMARLLPNLRLHTRWTMSSMLSYLCKCFSHLFFHGFSPSLSFILPLPPILSLLLSIVSHSSCKEWKIYHSIQVKAQVTVC